MTTPTLRTAAVASALLLTSLGAAPAACAAQGAPPGVLEELAGQFEASARKLVALAGAMPAETYAWRPAEGVASVAEVYMHIARYNYYYPDVALDVDPPAGIDYEQLQGVVNDKARVQEVLAASMDHVRGALRDMSAEELARPTRLYGRDVARWAVLLQLVTHMNEHLGQSIAYARTNAVVPPWSG